MPPEEMNGQGAAAAAQETQNPATGTETAPESTPQNSAPESGSMFSRALADVGNSGGEAANSAAAGEQEQEAPAANGASFELPEEYRNDPMFANFRTLEDLCKSYRYAKKTIGKKTVGMISEQSSPEEVSEFYGQLGAHADAAEYKVKFSDAMPELFRSDAVLGKYRAAFAKHHVPEAMAAGLMKEIEADVLAQLAEEQATRQASFDRNIASLKRDWGDNYNINMNKAQAAWQKLRPDWDIKTHPLGDNFDVIRLMADIYDHIADDTMVHAGNDAPAALNAIETEMGSIRNNPAYYTPGPEHDRLVKRMNELASRRRSLRSTPASID